MHLLWWCIIIVAVMLLPLVVIALKKYRQRRAQLQERKKIFRELEQAIYDWQDAYERAEESDDPWARLELPPAPKGADWGYRRQIEVLSELKTNVDKFRSRTETIRTGDPSGEDYDKLVELFKDLNDLETKHQGWKIRKHVEEEYAWVRETISAIAEAKAAELLAAAQEGDRLSFLTLLEFTEPYGAVSYGWEVKGRYKYQTGKAFVCPDNWAVLVVNYLKNPTFGDFRIPADRFHAGDCVHMAAEAVRTRSLVTAQLVLAMCRLQSSYNAGNRTTITRFHWREEIGDVLLDRVARLVDELHQEKARQLKLTTTTE